MVWSCLQKKGITCYGLLFERQALHCMVWLGFVCERKVLHVMVWFCIQKKGIACYGVVLYAKDWHCMVPMTWYGNGMAWFVCER